MATVKRRVFTIVSAVSLVLCLATAGVWIAAFARAGDCRLRGGVYVGWNRSSNGIVWVSRTTTRAERSGPRWRSYGRMGFGYGWMMFDGGVVLESVSVSCWFLCTLTAFLPAIWLWRYRRHRRVAEDGMPHCAKCDYNLTGNVSGICPECGTAVPADLVRRPVS